MNKNFAELTESERARAADALMMPTEGLLVLFIGGIVLLVLAGVPLISALPNL